MGCKGRYEEGGLIDPYKLLTGMTKEEVYAKALAGEGPVTEDPNLTGAPAHALAGKGAAERLGPDAAHILGFLHEIPTAISNLVQGKPMITMEGQGGFSLPDIIANTQGIEAREGIMKLAPSSITPIIKLLLMGQDYENTPRRQEGGMVPPPGKFTMRVPTKDLVQSFQAGGLVGDIISQIQGVNVPQVGQMGNVAQNLQNFDPYGGRLGGTAQGTMSNLLGTGSPVDVAGITDVAQARAGRTFGDLASGINEEFGALGLGSSSARTKALADAASDMSAQVGEAGILAGVGAEEAARGRQLGAMNPFLAGSGQQMGAQQSAGQLFGGAGNLNLASQIQPAQVGTQLTGQMMPHQAAQMNQVPQLAQNSIAPPISRGGGGARRGPGMGSGMGAASVAAPQMGNPSNPGGHTGGSFAGGGNNPFVFKSQRGGEVPRRNFQAQGDGDRTDYGDYLSDVLFGQKFNRLAAQPSVPPPQLMMPQGLGAAQTSTAPLQQYTPPRTDILSNDESAGYMNDVMTAMRLLGQAAQPSMIAQGMHTGMVDATPMQKGMSIANMNPALLQMMLGGEEGGRIPSNASGMGDILGIQAPGAAQGGEVQGPEAPPDQVPILATGGEVVLDPPTVALVDAYDGSPEMAQAIVEQVIEVSQREPEMKKFQSGGGIPSYSDRDLWSGRQSNFSIMGADEPTTDPAGMIAEQAKAARRRADLYRQAAFNSPRGAPIHQLAEQAEAAAQHAETLINQQAVAGVTRRSEQTTDIDQDVTHTDEGAAAAQDVKAKAATEEATRKAAAEREKRVRQRMHQILNDPYSTTEGPEEAIKQAMQEEKTLQQVLNASPEERSQTIQEVAGGSPQNLRALDAMEAVEQATTPSVSDVIVNFQVLKALGYSDEILEAIYPKSVAVLEAHVGKNK